MRRALSLAVGVSALALAAGLSVELRAFGVVGLCAGALYGFSVDVRTGRDTDVGRSTALADTLLPARALLAALGDVTFTAGYGGTDLLPLARGGVPSFGVNLDESGYWPVHHTVADTADKIDPTVVRRNTAAIAVFAWWLAHHPPVVESNSVGTPPEDR